MTFDANIPSNRGLPEGELAACFHVVVFFLQVCWLLACLTSQQHAAVSQGRICSDNCTCCHTEIEVADQTFYLTHSQYTDSGSTSPSTNPITPGDWQGSHRGVNFEVTGMTRPGKIPSQAGIELQIFRSRGVKGATSQVAGSPAVLDQTVIVLDRTVITIHGVLSFPSARRWVRPSLITSDHETQQRT